MKKYLSQLLALFLFLCLSPALLAAGVLLGDQNVESTIDSNAAGRAQAFQTTASGSDTLTSLSLYVDSNSSASQIAIGIYSDASSNPSSLLTQATFIPQAGAWNTVSVPPVAVVSGTTYWIAVLGLGSGRLYFRDTSGNNRPGIGPIPGCSSAISSSGSLTELPAAWSTGGFWRWPIGGGGPACALSAYGSTSNSDGGAVSVTLSPSSASLLTGGTQQFTATVRGIVDTTVTWTASAGSITSSGLYTAPATAGTYTVTATSVADATKSASATVTVAAGASGMLLGDLNVESTLDSNAAGRAQAFQTTAGAGGLLGSLNLYIDATSTASQVAIGVYSDSGGHPSVLLSQATFAPAAGSWNTVTVPPALVVAGTPYWIAVLGLGSGRLYFRDTINGCTSEGSNSSTLDALPATWSTGDLWTACALSAYGLGIANPSPSTVLVLVSPTVSLLSAGGTQQFIATVAGTSNTAVTWSATGGSISSSGLYTAPATAGIYIVTATSDLDPTKSASAIVTVTAPVAHSVTLTWTASTSSVAGYNVYRAAQSGGPYTMINTALQPGTSYADLSVQAGNTYYYVVTAADSSGTESVNSNEVTAAVPSP